MKSNTATLFSFSSLLAASASAPAPAAEPTLRKRREHNLLAVDLLADTTQATTLQCFLLEDI
jgi:hypothetical protein